MLAALANTFALWLIAGWILFEAYHRTFTEEVESVTVIHDVHVWTITSGSEAFTAHVLVDPSLSEEDIKDILERIHDITHYSYGIDHVTIQVEQSVANCREDHHVGHLEYTSRPSAA